MYVEGWKGLKNVLMELLGLRLQSVVSQGCTFERAYSKVSFITDVKFVRPILYEGVSAVKISTYPRRGRLAMAKDLHKPNYFLYQCFKRNQNIQAHFHERQCQQAKVGVHAR